MDYFMGAFSFFSHIEIAAENSFPGRDPVEPEVRYLSQEPQIQALISMRMNADQRLEHQQFTLDMKNSSGIKQNEAAKIDAVLNSRKDTGNSTVSSEAQNETGRFLEYEIDF